MIKVSVIVLCYNGEKFIPRCFESLRNQTLDNFEVIIVNDGSEDDSLNIINSRITDLGDGRKSKVINFTTNHGQAYCRIKGIEAASGEYVIACDIDDYIDQKMLETLYAKAKCEDIDIVSCDFYRVIGNKKIIDVQPISNSPIENIKLILLAKKWGGVWNHLIKRSLLDGIKPPESNIMEDTNILIQCLLKAKNCSHISCPLYYYVIHNNSTTSSTVSFQTLYEQAVYMNINVLAIESFVKEKGLTELNDFIEYRKFFNKRWINPIIKSVKDCKYWISINSEINCKFLLNPKISFRDKIISILIIIRVYPFIKSIYANYLHN